MNGLALGEGAHELFAADKTDLCVDCRGIIAFLGALLGDSQMPAGGFAHLCQKTERSVESVDAFYLENGERKIFKGKVFNGRIRKGLRRAGGVIKIFGGRERRVRRRGRR